MAALECQFVKRRAYALMVTTPSSWACWPSSPRAALSTTRSATPTASSARPGCGCRCSCCSARSSLDIVPRTLWRSRLQPAQFKGEALLRIREHWTRDRILLVVLGLVCFYVTYVSYRNLKNFLPFVRSLTASRSRRPRAAQVRPLAPVRPRSRRSLCTTVLGTTISAHVLSWVYLIFLPMVPVAVIVWLVWSRNVSFGYWFVTAQCMCWTLGTASYYMIPTLGPNFAFALALRRPAAHRASPSCRRRCTTGAVRRALRPCSRRRAVRGRLRLPARRRSRC